MKIDIISPPPPLTFGEGDQQFKLHLKRFTAEDRAVIVDSLLARENNIALTNRAIERVIETWSDVYDEGGSPVPMKVTDDDGNESSNLGKFLGAIPPALHMEVLRGVLVFIGVDEENIVDLSQLFKGNKGGKTADPTAPPAGATSKKASGGSSK